MVKHAGLGSALLVGFQRVVEKVLENGSTGSEFCKQAENYNKDTNLEWYGDLHFIILTPWLYTSGSTCGTLETRTAEGALPTKMSDNHGNLPYMYTDTYFLKHVKNHTQKRVI